ncbi:hypothetical protein KZ440_10735 [Glaesserella parasuis]|nr:hypothetical protein [Glaesserella parasuis]MCT8788407.1 hypothetical protein [Glaesserella parasuis]
MRPTLLHSTAYRTSSQYIQTVLPYQSLTFSENLRQSLRIDWQFGQK